MVQTPTKQLIALMEKAKHNQRTIVKSGTYEMYVDGEHIILIHYGTRIFEWKGGKNDVDTHGAYSASDRDAINSICKLLKERSCARIKDGTLIFDNEKWHIIGRVE